MKKLMTVIASVALAFGLQAATEAFVFNQTDFSGANVGPLDLTENDNGGNTPPFYWAGDVGDSEIKAVSEADGAAKFLAIENSNPLYRTVLTGPNANSQEIGTGVFADMYVKFTASDAADPVVLADGSKLGIWVAVDDEADTPSTNLMVCAASLVNGWDAPVATNFTIALDADFDFKAEHRVTIRAIEEISEGKLKMAGFVLYIDEKLVAAADADYADKIGFTAFNSVAKPFYANKQLFVSLVEAGTLSAQTIYGVGFKGTGELSKVALADADHAPDFAKPAVDVTFAWGAGIESFTYQGIATNVGGKAGSVVVTLAGPTVPVTLSNVTASDGYVLGDIEAEGLDEVEDGVWAFVEAPASLTMTAGEVAFTIGDKKYATFEDALAEADGETIKLAKNFAPEDELSIGEDVAIDFTLDLAGNDIVVGEDYSETDIFWIREGSSLTFIDSIGGGEVITEGAESLESVFYSDGQLYVGLDDGDEGVTVNGTLEGGNAPVIVKGNFDKAGNGEDEFAYTIDTEKYEVVTLVDGYWTVQAKQAEPEVPGVKGTIIEVAGFDAAMNFAATNTAPDYADWDGYFTITANGDCSADLYGTYSTYEMQKFGNYEFTADKSVQLPVSIKWYEMVAIGEDGFTAAISNIVAETAGKVTFTVTLTLTDGETELTLSELEAEVDAKAAEVDPTTDDPEKIPDDETAEDRYGDKIPPALADVSAKSICIWAKGNGQLVKGDVILEDAFLLDCANTEKAVEDAKKEAVAALEIAKIEFVEGKWVVTQKEGKGDGDAFNTNAKIIQIDVTKDIDPTLEAEDGTKGFFKLGLAPKTLN